MLMIDGILSKTVKRGFEFTLMVVGESGLGKSTMINSLFLTELYRNRTLPPVQVGNNSHQLGDHSQVRIVNTHIVPLHKHQIYNTIYHFINKAQSF